MSNETALGANLWVEDSLLESAQGIFKKYMPPEPTVDEVLMHQILPIDVFSFEEDWLLIENLPSTFSSTLEALITFYQAPQAGFNADGFKLASKTPHLLYPLHFAAKDGNLAEIIKLNKEGIDLNSKDPHQSTALHIAALFDQQPIITYLIKQGAWVNDKGYQGFTPLQLAVYKENYAIARLLITEGKADLRVTNEQSLNALTQLTLNLIQALEPLTSKASTPADIEKIKDILSTLEVASTHCAPYCHFSPFGDKSHPEKIIPLSLELRLLTSYAPTLEIKTLLLSLADKIARIDPTEEVFVQVKNFLQVFPTGSSYELKLDETKSILVTADGYYALETTKLAKNSINEYLQQLNRVNTDKTQLAIFTEILHIYSRAEKWLSEANIPQTAQEALKLFQQGETILLPSGWNNHFVDVILSKPQQAYLVSNSGLTDTLNPAGISIYHVQDPEKIDQRFIHQTLTNKQQILFEFINMYEYGIIQKVGHLPTPLQQYGNCAWESHKNAMKGLIFLELLNKGFSVSTAEELTASYAHEWGSFHETYQIEQFLAISSGLGAEILIDAMGTLYKKLAQHDEDAFKQADKMLSILSTTHAQEFNHWLQKNQIFPGEKAAASVQAVEIMNEKNYSSTIFQALNQWTKTMAAVIEPPIIEKNQGNQTCSYLSSDSHGFMDPFAELTSANSEQLGI